MKRIFLFLCAVLLLGGCAAPNDAPAAVPAETKPADAARPGAGVEVSCMSFNILAYNTGNSSYALPEERAPGIISLIREQNADIVGVQEAAQHNGREPFDWVKTLTEELADTYDARVILEDSPSFWDTPISAGLIIFYRKGRFTMEDSDCYEYYDDANRYFQWVKLRDEQAGGRTLFVTNTHLSIEASGGNAARVGEAKELYEFWTETVGKEALFGTGDYNCYDFTDPHVILQQGPYQPSYNQPDEAGAATIDFCYTNTDCMTVTKYQKLEKSYDTPSGNIDVSDHSAVMTYAAYK